MKVLFCWDGPLFVDGRRNYFSLSQTDETLSRYFSIGDELVILTRLNDVTTLKSDNGISKLSNKLFDVKECPSLTSNLRYFDSRKKAKEIILSEVKKTDCVVARLPGFISILAVDIAKKLNIPYLIEVVGCPFDSLWNHSIKGKLIAPLMHFLVKTKVRNADYSVYVTNEFLQKRYPSKGKSVNCSNVMLDDFDDTILDSRLERINCIDKNSKLIIGTLGALNIRYKGQQYVIEALGRLKKQGKTRFEYQLMGGGDWTYLESVAKKFDVYENVKFIGAIPHDEVVSWLDNIDLYIQPSLQEGLPRALIEAMSRGLPAFGSRAGGIPELLDECYTFGNSCKKINEIKSLLSAVNKKDMEEQAIRNYEWSKLYSKDIIEERRREFFRKFSQENKRIE